MVSLFMRDRRVLAVLQKNGMVTPCAECEKLKGNRRIVDPRRLDDDMPRPGYGFLGASSTYWRIETGPTTFVGRAS